MCDWKVDIQHPCKGSSKWCVRLTSKRVTGKQSQLRLRYCDSMEIAEAIKSRVLVLLVTMSEQKIKAQLDMEKDAEKSDWCVGTSMDRSKCRVYIRSRQFEGKKPMLHVYVRIENRIQKHGGSYNGASNNSQPTRSNQ
jgi:hypothetical protein